MTTEDRVRTAAIAQRLGMKPMTLVFLVLANEFDQVHGLTEDERAFCRTLLPRPSSRPGELTP